MYQFIINKIYYLYSNCKDTNYSENSKEFFIAHKQSPDSSPE